MPDRLTNEEIIDFVHRLLHCDVTDKDFDKLTKQDHRDISALVMYELDRRRWNAKAKVYAKAQRRARRLLRSFLTPTQLKHLRDRRGFKVRGSLGGLYRLYPATGIIYKVERHGKRFYDVVSYCLHDIDSVMPSADVSLGQMLMLMSDEQEFLDLANATDQRSQQLWNGDYLRLLNQGRRERASAAATTVEDVA